MINLQPIEKRVEDSGQELDVHSIFYTIQGEGPYAGMPAVFIRLAGCNLQCPACDTEYTKGRRTLPVSKILEEVRLVHDHLPSDWNPIVVITGGEPFRQNLELLVPVLTSYYRVQIETNGTFGFRNAKALFYADIVCSPKTGKVHSAIAGKAKWYKYVLSHDSVDPSDGLPIFALDHSASPRVARPSAGTKVFVQPADAQDPIINKKNLDAAVASCLKYGYTLQLQIHKIIGVE